MGAIVKTLAGITVAAALAMSAPAFAEGNLAANGTDLPELKIDTENLKFSETEYQLETGKYYRLDITSDGGEELAIMFPELVRNAWFNQIVVNDLEVKAAGLYSLEFDDAGTFSISFVPVRPGEYAFWAPGFESKGLKGKFIVK